LDLGEDLNAATKSVIQRLWVYLN